MAEVKNLISHLRDTLYIATALVSLIFYIVRTIPYFRGPEIVYSTKELMAYPITYKNNRPAPAYVQGRALVNGQVKILDLVVQNKGARSASDILVRIPVSGVDEYIGGWMTKSEAPSTVYMLGAKREFRFHNLIPGDTISFCLYLNAAKSNLAYRIRVYTADGRLATHFRYIPVPYVSGDAVVFTTRKRWIDLFGLAMAVVLLLSVVRIRKPKQPPVPMDTQNRHDESGQLPSSPTGSSTRDQVSRDPPSSHRKEGGR